MEIRQIDRRIIEAEMLGRVYEELCRTHDRDAALAVIANTVARAGREAGKAFAAAAPGGPSLAHFKTVVDIWRAGGALDIAVEEDSDTAFSFRVTRCGYVDAYREAGMPEELCRTISCNRDAPFAEAYDPRLTLERPCTIAAGAEACRFRFVWTK
ncbi:L-2-amino-thiazoline-4-carboxylic acid hydrolase [Salidesulfovibrio brasiliensis]|uniref:L-2-amino-thiazoline-4-carboxylic acid hydrolase n=1 Tax=Salidesulfovibrio brasiliensis TaxID=221711 RepID=UPI0006D200F7|nr:L-2-amino-thiazoline-4-carboxylic acid hydrolase [Salidesulfovibrio brasiliensis]